MDGSHGWWTRRAARWLAVVAWLVLGVAWAVASPPGSSPDDDFHLGSIWCAWGREATGCVVEDSVGGRSSVLVPSLRDAYSTCVALRGDRSAACQFDGELNPLIANRGGYPPGFYGFLRLFASDQAAVSIVAMRLVVWGLGTALWLALFALIPGTSRHRMMLAVLASAVPLTLFLASSTNPSAALITGIPVAALAAIFTPRLTTRAGKAGLMLAVVAALVAVLSRSDAPFLLGVAAVGAAVARSGGRTWRQAWLAPSAVLAVAIVGLAFRGSQAEALTTGLSPGAGGQALSLLTVLQQLPVYFVGEIATTIGYMDVPMPAFVWASVASAMAAIALLGLWSWTRTKGVAIALILAGQLAGLLFLQTRTSFTIQPRYFLPLTLTWFALVAWVPPGAKRWRLNRAQGVLLWTAVSLAHAVALRQLLERYMFGVNSSKPNPSLSNPEWWWDVPVPALAVWLVGSAAFAGVLLWVVAVVIGDSGRWKPIGNAAP